MERIIGRNIRKAEIILINIIFNAWFLALCSILGFQNLNPIGFYYTEKSEKILFRLISSYKNSCFSVGCWKMNCQWNMVLSSRETMAKTEY